jgi:hypothetical protein
LSRPPGIISLTDHGVWGHHSSRLLNCLAWPGAMIEIQVYPIYAQSSANAPGLLETRTTYRMCDHNFFMPFLDWTVKAQNS